MAVHADEDVEQRRHSSIAGGRANLYTQYGNQYGGLSQNWEPTEDTAIPLLGIYCRNAPSYHKDTCSAMFKAALFMLARKWKQYLCPSTKEWKNKMWHIWTMGYLLE